MKWFKFYGQDWNTDPKIASMSMEDRLCLVTLLTIASSEDKDGFIPSLTEDSLITISRIPDWKGSDYNPRESVTGVMERYKALHIVTLDRNGGVTVCNFKRRQGENLTNAERQKNYRNRHKMIKKYSNNSNVDVTTTVTLDKNRIDKNRIEYKEEDNKSNLPLWIDIETWNNWTSYRRDKKQSLTKRTIELQLKFLSENKQEHVEIINQSIRNGWTGLFPLKNKPIPVYKNKESSVKSDKKLEEISKHVIRNI